MKLLNTGVIWLSVQQGAGQILQGYVQLCLEGNCFSGVEMVQDSKYWQRKTPNMESTKNTTAKSHLSTPKACWLPFHTAYASCKQSRGKRAANHLRGREQLMHIEQETPCKAFFFPLEVSKGR